MMRRQTVIGVSEAVTILFIFISAKTFLSYGRQFFHESYNAAWMVPLVQTFVGLAGVLLLAALLQKYPGRNLVEIGEELAGPYINVLFALFYLTVFVIGAALTLRGVSERVEAGYLPNTPISMVVLSFAVGAVVVGYLGPEAATRTARFLLGVLLVSTMVLIALTVPLWRFHTLYPLWGSGPLEILKAGLTSSGDFVQILLLGIIYPFLPGGKVKQVGVWGVAIAGFFMFAYIWTSLLVFTYPAVSELALPSFEISRMVNIGRFGQRVEVLFMPVSIFANLIFLSVSLYAAASVLCSLCKLRDYRPFVPAMAVLVQTVAFIPQNVPQLIYWNEAYLSKYSLGALAGILLVLMLIARFKGKGGIIGE
jgi:spore germination protein (amino acid permease)